MCLYQLVRTMKALYFQFAYDVIPLYFVRSIISEVYCLWCDHFIFCNHYCTMGLLPCGAPSGDITELPRRSWSFVSERVDRPPVQAQSRQLPSELPRQTPWGPQEDGGRGPWLEGSGGLASGEGSACQEDFWLGHMDRCANKYGKVETWYRSVSVFL